MKAQDYRWPGYAIEDGVLYETASAAEGQQLWRVVERVWTADLIVLLHQVQTTGPMRYPSMPSNGVVLP